MGTKVHHLEALPGIKDLHTLLEVINNKAKYLKILDELESLRKDTNEKIELVGKAEEIENLHTQANILADEAKYNLSSANEEASKIVEDSKIKASEIIKSATDRENRAKEKMTSLEDYETKKMRELKDKEISLNEKRKETDKKEIEASNLYDKACLLKKTYEDAIKKLEDAGVKIAI